MVAGGSSMGQSIATPNTRGLSFVGLNPCEPADDERKATRRSRMACAESCANATPGASAASDARTSAETTVMGRPRNPLSFTLARRVRCPGTLRITGGDRPGAPGRRSAPPRAGGAGGGYRGSGRRPPTSPAPRRRGPRPAARPQPGRGGGGGDAGGAERAGARRHDRAVAARRVDAHGDAARLGDALDRGQRVHAASIRVRAAVVLVEVEARGAVRID